MLKRASFARPVGLLCIACFLLLPLFAKAGTKFKVIHAFKAGSDGGYPNAAPVMDKLGNLYGLAPFGGSGTGCSTTGCGVAYETTLRGSQWTEKVVYDFSTDGPTQSLGFYGGLTLEPRGALYGAQDFGGDPVCNCGEIFKLTRSANGWTKTALYSFLGTTNGNQDGGYPGPVILDAAGNLYGVTVQGGLNYGTVFKLAPNPDGSWTESVIYKFTNGRDGAGPAGSLAIDSAGNLFGVANSDGIYGYGTVFQLVPTGDTWSENTIYEFTGGNNGGSPNSGVTIDAAGNLYGTASQYGADFVGVVFKLSPTIGFWNYSVLHTFTGGRDGGFPYAGLTLDANGNLYGATYYGGLYQYGTIYKLSNVNGKWQETVLHSFANGTDGASPYGSVLVDSSGNVFGTAQSGGAYGYGVLYEITQQ